MRHCEFAPTGRPAPARFGQGAIEYCCVRPRCGNHAYTAHAAEQIHAVCRDPHWFGLGDLAAWLARRLGLRGGARCGCARRRAWLNRLVGLRLKGLRLSRSGPEFPGPS